MHLNGENFTLNKGEKIYTQRATHRITNDEDATLEILEVQVGEYLGEDDIVRLEDDFDRGFKAISCKRLRIEVKQVFLQIGLFT